MVRGEKGGKMAHYKCQKYVIQTSNEDKKLFLPSPVTKGDLIYYYCHIAQYMVPFTKNHPLVMVRYPNGIKEEGFYQKDTPDYFPDWIKRVAVKHGTGITNYVVANNADTLVYLANQGCITPHLWLSRADKLEYPDRMIFDIDPGKQPFSLVQQIALEIREILEKLDLVSFPMTTGSQGIHVTVPLNRRSNFDEVRQFARDIAVVLTNKYPQQLTLEMRIAKRRGRLFIDTLRNGFGATAVAPYGARPKPKAPVATPLLWKEVDDAQLTSQKYNVSNIFARLDKKGDVWKSFFKTAHSLTKAKKSLEKIKKDL